MLEKITPSERRAVASVFAGACLAFAAWAYPNMTQLVTIPGAVICGFLTIYFLKPEIIALGSRTFLKAVIAVAVTGAILGQDYWYYSNYSTNGGIWHISLGINPSQESPSGPSMQPLPPTTPIISRSERFIFACDVPPPKNADEATAQKDTLERNVQGWADTLGVTITFADIDGGIRITGEAKSFEAKARFISMGIVGGITKIYVEARRIGEQQILAVYADVPKKSFFIWGLIPDPRAPQVIEGQNLLTKFVGGECHML
jgi:hypothetical protein